MFQVDQGVTASISGLTITEGSAAGSGGGLYNDDGFVTLTQCTISGNSALDGGGIYNRYDGGTATLTDCAISGNSAVTNGGGLESSGVVTLSGCSISDNSAYYGGGLRNGGTATLSDCTISGNSATGSGGGLDNRSTAAITDCTISGNSAANYGGGLLDEALSFATAAIADCTISGNTAINGGGCWLYDAKTSTMNNTIVAGNTDTGGSAGDITATGLTGSYNLVGAGGSGGLNAADDNLLDVADPGLAPLANNGGPTETMALLPGSPAIGAGTVVSGTTTDERGQPLDTPPDIGAYQTQTSQPIDLTFTGLTSPSITYGTASVTLSGTLANGAQSPPNTESVQVTVNGVTQSAEIGAGGAFSTTFDTSTVSVSGSPYSISYSYRGDGTFASANISGTLTIGRATPKVNVTDVGGTFSGSSFPATAAVAGISGTASSRLEGVTPALTYYAGNTPAGTPLAGPPSQGGTYTVVASFAGSSDYKPAQSEAVTFTIQPAIASVGLSASATSAVYGQSVTFLAKVTGPGAAPGGSVTFADGGTILGTVSLDGSGQAALTTSNLPTGTLAITASYSGNADFTQASSRSVALSVAKAVAEPSELPPQPVVRKKQVVSLDLIVEFGSTGAGASLPRARRRSS